MHLKGEYYSHPHRMAENVNRVFGLQQTDSGLAVGMNRNQERYIAHAHECYRDSHRNQNAKGVGCAALNAKMADDTAALEAMWQKVVDVCAADGRYFRNGLRTMERAKE